MTEAIISAAFTVSNRLGCGFLEKVYENAMAIELRKRGHQVEQQKPMDVRYESEIVGIGLPRVDVQRVQVFSH